MKKIMVGAIGLVAVVIAVAVFLFSNLNGIIQDGVEKIGSEATQATVTLDKVDISITSGSGVLSGLIVGNPSGFKTPSAFELGGIAIQIDTDSIGGDVIIIKEIVITAPKITYELTGTASNIDAIQKNVDAYAEKFSSSDNSGGSPNTNSGGGETKLVIENLYIRDGSVGVSAGFLAGKKLETSLPDIHLKDIGKASDGASPAEIAQKIIAAMTSGTGSAVGSLGLDKMMDGALQDASKAVETLTQGAGDVTGSITKDATKALEGVGSSLKGLLGN